MSVSLTYAAVVTARETLETSVAAATAGNRVVIHNQYNSSATLDANTTPPVTKVAAFSQALTAGAATIDLTALTGTNGASVDGTGLKVQVFKIKNKGANNLTVKFGASNPYNLLGASWTLILAQNQEITVYGNDATPDIASGAKNIDLSGTTTQTSEVVIVMG